MDKSNPTAEQILINLAKAVRQYFTAKTQGGSLRSVNQSLTDALWEADKFITRDQKEKDKKERAERKAAAKIIANG